MFRTQDLENRIIKYRLTPKYIVSLYGILIILLFSYCSEDNPIDESTNNISTEIDTSEIKDSIHAKTGLVMAKGFPQVRALCTPCHSAKLITQNRASRDGWEKMIRWMQETQGLMDLGDNEPIILDYLAAHYAPQEIGRRSNLDLEKIEWYILEVD